MQAGAEKWKDDQVDVFLETGHRAAQSGIPPRTPGGTSSPQFTEMLASHGGVRRRSGDRHVKLASDDDNDDDDMY